MICKGKKKFKQKIVAQLKNLENDFRIQESFNLEKKDSLKILYINKYVLQKLFYTEEIRSINGKK